MPNIANCKWLMVDRLIKATSSHSFSLKAVVCSLFVLSLLASHLSLISAQTPYEQAKHEYAIQIKKYNDANNAYITARSNYLAFNTITAKKDAFDKTKSYLAEADFLLTKHLFVVKEFGNQINWTDNEFSRQDQIALLDEEIDFLQYHWARTEQTTTLEELPPLASELQKRLDNEYFPKRNKVIAVFEVVKIQSAHKNFNEIFEKLLTFVEPKISDSNKLLVSNWQSEVEGINSVTTLKIEQSISSLKQIKIDRQNNFKIKSVIKTSKIAKNELKKSTNLFEEILRIL